jgi:very-short-patch-repair endonuclease
MLTLHGPWPQPVPQFVVVENGRFLGKVDLAWPDAKLVVEYEGPHHFADEQIVRDDERYRRLIAAGWRVIRLSAADLRDLDAVVARIAAALRKAPAAG